MTSSSAPCAASSWITATLLDETASDKTVSPSAFLSSACLPCCRKNATSDASSPVMASCSAYSALAQRRSNRSLHVSSPSNSGVVSVVDPERLCAAPQRKARTGSQHAATSMSTRLLSRCHESFRLARPRTNLGRVKSNGLICLFKQRACGTGGLIIYANSPTSPSTRVKLGASGHETVPCCCRRRRMEGHAANKEQCGVCRGLAALAHAQYRRASA